MCNAYENLFDFLKKEIDYKLTIHDCSYNSARMLRKRYKEVSSINRMPGARHQTKKKSKK